MTAERQRVDLWGNSVDLDRFAKNLVKDQVRMDFAIRQMRIDGRRRLSQQRDPLARVEAGSGLGPHVWEGDQA